MSGWHLAYEGYDPTAEGQRESLCALGNGYLCSRAAAPDAQADGVHYAGNYLAGLYDRAVSEVSGHRVENEDLVNIPNWLPLVLRIGDGPWLRPKDLDHIDYRQHLDMLTGTLHRSLRFREPEGRVVRWEERRFVSMDHKHLAGLEVRLTAEGWSGEVTVYSSLEGGVINGGIPRYMQLETRHLETLETDKSAEDTVFLRSRTVQSRREIALAARTRLYGGAEGAELAPARRDRIEGDTAGQELTFQLDDTRTVTVEKMVAIHTSKDMAISEPGLASRELVAGAERFEDCLVRHRRHWGELWELCDIKIDSPGNSHVEGSLRLQIYHILQTVSYRSIHLDVGVPPRGWTGEAYRGHIMWDELYVFPFLSLRLPVVARAILLYRYRRLGAAQRLAREAGYRGAMFPWMSGSDGREETQVLHLNPASGRWVPDNTNRQRHVSAAIAFNVWSYYQATDDHEFMYFYGTELLCEIARFWCSAAEFDVEKGRYVIRKVMGPDEFHTAYPGTDPTEEGGIDNNAYTNVMAAWCLATARDSLELLPADRQRQLRDALGISEAELERWDDITRRLYVPFMAGGIIEQFEGYRDLKEIDWEHYRAKHGNIQRLDRILEAEGDDPNNYQVAKQADTLMLFYLFSADELSEIFERLGYRFERACIPATVDYYAARTSRGSTLSLVVDSWVMARRQRPESWDSFLGALTADLTDVQGGTTREGIHIGAMAGAVDIVQRCYTGLELRANTLFFNPVLPKGVASIETRIRYRRQIIDVEVTRDTLTLRSGRFAAMPINVAYRGHHRELSPGESCSFRLIVPPEQRESVAEGAAE